MILVDVNLLIYAVNQDSPDHHSAKSWLESANSGTETVGLPWIVLLAFLRLTTRPGIFQKPLSVDAAFDVVDAWLQQGTVTVPEPTVRHLQTMRDLILRWAPAGTLPQILTSRLWRFEHRAELCSTDNDFGRFNRLRWRNPLA
jgi:toxin-antitoxin system PIN domain toxin